MYLDNAATSFPRPDCVHTAVAQWMRSDASAGRGSHAGSMAASSLLQQCRTHVARLLKVPSASQVVFTSNCTDSLNTVLLGLLKPGEHVLATTLDHNSVLRPLEFLRQQRNVHPHLVPFDPVSGLLDADAFQKVLRDFPIRLTILNHASNVTGRVQDVRWLTSLAHQSGSLVLLDAAQTAGHHDCQMDSLDVDFLATAGHKGIPGPLGTGLLCFRAGCGSLVQPLKFGGTGTASESLQQPESTPEKFESGNLNVPGIAGLNAAVTWVQSETPARIQQHIFELTELLLNGLSTVRGLRLLTPMTPQHLCGIVSFTIAGMDCREVATILDQSFDIQCRAGLHCAPLAHEALGTLQSGGAVRLSPGPFNTTADIQNAIEAVHAIASEVR